MGPVALCADQVPAPLLYEAAQVPFKHQLLRDAAKDPQWGSKLDPVGHEGAAVVRLKAVDVPEGGKRSSHLFVGEGVWALQFGDPAGHPQRDPEMPGTPGDLLAEPELPLRGAGHRALTGMCHGFDMGIDVQGQLKQLLRRHGGLGAAFKGGAHVAILPVERLNPGGVLACGWLRALVLFSICVVGVGGVMYFELPRLPGTAKTPPLLVRRWKIRRV